MTDTNPLTLVGLVLTLASVVGSFFYIQLSQWLRDLLAVAAKIELYSHGDNPDKDKALLEARIENRKLSSWHLLVTNAVIIAFVCYLVVIGLKLIDAAQADPSYPVIRQAFVIFGLIFAGLSIVLFLFGVYRMLANAKKLGD